MDLTNPFVIGSDIPVEFFCDREAEIELLQKHIANGRNIVLSSPRRLGKSGLIHHFYKLPKVKKNYSTFFVDIYATKSIEEFIYEFSKAVQKEQAQQKKWYERFFEIVSTLRFAFKLDSNTGEPSFELKLGEIKTPQKTLDEIFDYLESEKRPCIVAIDEFQQIAEYEETSVEALLRTKIQQCNNTRFIFSGSRQHILNEMFYSRNKPFYQSAISMNLEAIPVDVYCEFAKKMFALKNKKIDADVIREVYSLFEGTTWFVQMLMNELFALTPENGDCPQEFLNVALQNIILMQEQQYKDMFTMFSLRQKMLLLAIAQEGVAREVTSGAFVAKYGLSSPSSVQASLKGLKNKLVLTEENGTYRLSDYFFAYWLNQR
ncbi:ATP-binding protein [Fibrobacter succinogenes]|uniref:AAA family ATPase n=1 Tax=Fibrobacter succinogenes TaxID=833 RepID=UPI001569279C|nr:ATP-binding protein [Fibrobacter succinogenes]